MYFVDQEKIEEILSYMNELLQELNRQTYDSYLEKLGLERISHMLIESIIDVGNLMIDGFIMRDPGSYEDIIDILIDEKVLPENEEKAYKEIIGFRKVLVKEYRNVDHDELSRKFKEHVAVLENFNKRISEYLTNQFGVANAFKRN